MGGSNQRMNVGEGFSVMNLNIVRVTWGILCHSRRRSGRRVCRNRGQRSCWWNWGLRVHRGLVLRLHHHVVRILRLCMLNLVMELVIRDLAGWIGLECQLEFDDGLWILEVVWFVVLMYVFVSIVWMDVCLVWLCFCSVLLNVFFFVFGFNGWLIILENERNWEHIMQS